MLGWFLFLLLLIVGLVWCVTREYDIRWPFRKFQDKSGTRTDVVALTAPFRSHQHLNMYRSLRKRGVKIIGFTHYQEFPNSISNPFEDTYHKKAPFDYIKACDAWCYFQRDPDKAGLPAERRLDIVESDFADCAKLRGYVNLATPKRFDFVYCLPKDKADIASDEQCTTAWQAYHRNWQLADRCIKVLCEMGLSGVIVGRKCQSMQHPCVTMTPDMPYRQFLQLLRDSRFLFLPGIVEASPRKITEALCLDTPVLMNRDIMGGWKYINEHTGAFFTDATDVGAAARAVLKLTSTRAAFEQKWGKVNASKRMAAFLRKLGIETDDSVMLKIR